MLDEAEETETAVTNTPPGANVVGIGASAGGLEALGAFVSALELGTDFVWVIVQHLSPKHHSILDQLLQNNCKLDVRVIEDGMAANPDAVYVAPAGFEVRYEEGAFSLTAREAHGLSAPIDVFFTSLADALGRTAFAVVLSGTGSDGTAGVRAIKAAGGVALVQDSAGARFTGMPNAAAATGMVDAVLPAHDMPARIIDIASHRQELDNPDILAIRQAEIEEALPAIVKIVGQGSGHDFSGYKPGTLVRRIERRMALRRISKAANFIDVLSDDKDEAGRLLQDFLIGVTKFFRDPAVWDVLAERVIAPLLDTDRATFRVWVPGCSTGEEAYTVAILFLEALAERKDHRSVQVFGTDIDLPALSHARQGIFPPGALESVSEDRRAAFFAADGSAVRASPRLREACVFAPHNVIQDPPFSRLDLITCRNLMIYFGSEIQARTIERFHFAIRGEGHLLLGPSEGLAGQDSYFDLAEKESRLFRRNEATPPRYSPLGERLPRAGRLANPTGQTLPLPQVEVVGREARAERAFLERFAAPYAVVTRSGSVSYLSERMTSFVQPSRGAPSLDIDAYLSSALRLPVRSALAELEEAGDDAEPVIAPNIAIEENGEQRLIDVTVAPIEDEPGQALIVLSEVRAGERDLSETLAERDRADTDLLQREVESLRKRLSMMSSEYDTSSQELKSTNEELLSMNEELQSSNEELETSREELQSINEELETVNAELYENNNQLTRVNSDLKNLFEATDLAVLFLDANLLVRSYTPAVERLFRIKHRDVGRPITDLTSQIPYAALAEDAEEVKRTLQSVEREAVINATGETYIVRMKPYRTTDDRLDGVVLSFFDVTERERARRQLEKNAFEMQRQYAELETLYDTTPVGLSLIDREMRWVRINEELAAINGFSPEEHIGKKQIELIPDINKKIIALQQSVFDTGEPVLGMEVTGETPAEPGRTRHWVTDYYPVPGEEEVWAVGCCIREVTDEKELLVRVADSEARLRRTIDNLVAFAGVLDTDGTVKEANETALGAAGIAIADVEGKPFWDTHWWQTAPETVAQLKDSVERAAKGETVRYEAEIVVADEKRMEIDFLLAPVRNEANEIVELVASAYDITDRNCAKRQMETLLGELQHRVKNTLATVSAVARFVADTAETVDDYQQRLDSRLGAISRTHDILTGTEWRGANLSEIVAAEVAPYRTGEKDAPSIEGDDLALDPKEVLSLGMALHELTTNAVKHGALSVPGGSVTVTASNTGGEWTDLPRTIVWKERGGPKVTAPKHRGFGSFLIERVLKSDLKGEASMKFEEDGVRCCIALPAP